MSSDGSHPRPGGRDDRELVGAVLAGDMDAFATLYRIHARSVAAAVRDNVADAETVADVVQEVFLKALERLSTLRDPNLFGPWLMSIARHAGVDNRRGRARGPVIVDHEVDPPSGSPGPEVLAEMDELAGLIRTCVAGLPPRDATALTLVTQLGFGPADIAQALGVTPGTAKVILHRARHRLRDALALELLVRRRAGGCPSFDALYDAGDVVGAARHVRSCEACAALAAAEVSLYAARLTGV
jgi:RNA polymerase sigma factor (sigma-70 family)